MVMRVGEGSWGDFFSQNISRKQCFFQRPKFVVHALTYPDLELYMIQKYTGFQIQRASYRAVKMHQRT